jgi:hypothetical protein
MNHCIKRLGHEGGHQDGRGMTWTENSAR